jgi:hypothetical protein
MKPETEMLWLPNESFKYKILQVIHYSGSHSYYYNNRNL